jgi:hypothetical protein
MTDFLSLPPVAALIIAIFACGAGVIIGWAFPLKPDPDPDPAREESAEARYRRNME